nr:phosphoribosylglycinamide formyltransferase [Sediminivirga luteola]
MASVRCVILASGSGTLTQAVLDAFPVGRSAAGVDVVAVGSDQPGAGALERAERAGLPTFCEPLPRGATAAERASWNERLARSTAAHRPDWVVSAGFMRILGPAFLEAFPDRIINTHPALLPSFPGAHAVRDALAHGVKVTGSTIHLLDGGVDTGPIIAQVPVPVLPGDDEASLHERIREVERAELVEVLRFLAEGELTVEGRHIRGYPPAERE